MTRGLPERLAQIETEARNLARSDGYQNARSIEMELLKRGYQDAPTIFANQWTQSELKRLCEQAIRAGHRVLDRPPM